MSLNPQESIDILNLARSMELVAIGQYNEYIQKLSEIDHVSAQLLKKIIVEEEGHSQYFQDVVDHLTQLGPHYLAVQAGGAFDKTDYEKFIIG